MAIEEIIKAIKLLKKENELFEIRIINSTFLFEIGGFYETFITILDFINSF